MHDYPKNFANLFEDIIELLNDQSDLNKVHAGLHSLHALVIRYEYELNDSRAPLYEIILEVFPTIFQLSETLLKRADNEQAV